MDYECGIVFFQGEVGFVDEICWISTTHGRIYVPIHVQTEDRNEKKRSRLQNRQKFIKKSIALKHFIAIFHARFATGAAGS